MPKKRDLATLERTFREAVNNPVRDDLSWPAEPLLYKPVVVYRPPRWQFWRNPVRINAAWLLHQLRSEQHATASGRRAELLLDGMYDRGGNASAERSVRSTFRLRNPFSRGFAKALVGVAPDVEIDDLPVPREVDGQRCAAVASQGDVHAGVFATPYKSFRNEQLYRVVAWKTYSDKTRKRKATSLLTHDDVEVAFGLLADVHRGR